MTAAAAGAPAPVEGRAAFIRANTRLLAPPLAPEMRLHLADEAVDLWTKTEAELQASGLPPPFWAFAWAGGQALARWIGDHPERDRRPSRARLRLRFGDRRDRRRAGRRGEGRGERDRPVRPSRDRAQRRARTASPSRCCREDVIGADRGWDVVLAGDVAYERDMAAAAFAWLEGLARRGALVLVGDPRRSYLALDRLECLAEYSVPTHARARRRRDQAHRRVHVPLGARNRLGGIISAPNHAPFGPYPLGAFFGRNMQLYYATHDGQARRIAERIAGRLAERGIPVSPQDLAATFPAPEKLAEARLVTIVSAVRYGRHLPEESGFFRSTRRCARRRRWRSFPSVWRRGNRAGPPPRATPIFARRSPGIGLLQPSLWPSPDAWITRATAGWTGK